jgi:hypothetical protein
MRKTCPPQILLLMLPIAGRAQSILFPAVFHHLEFYYLTGPSYARTQTIGETNVTVYGSMGYSMALGAACQVVRKSNATLWIEFAQHAWANRSAETASVPGSVALKTSIEWAGLRVKVPVTSRISVFAAAGGGFGDFNNPTLSTDNPPVLKTVHVSKGVFGGGGGADFRLMRILSLRLDVRDYVTVRNVSGIPGRNHVLPMFGLVLHWY